jgi:hypothetical protein
MKTVRILTEEVLKVRGRSSLQALIEGPTAEIFAAVLSLDMRRKSQRRRTQSTEGRVATSRQRRCTCAVCPNCVDEARWERIFNERFATPDYYQARFLRNWSTLAGI